VCGARWRPSCLRRLGEAFEGSAGGVTVPGKWPVNGQRGQDGKGIMPGAWCDWSA
jgi:hypothetical protein